MGFQLIGVNILKSPRSIFNVFEALIKTVQLVHVNASSEDFQGRRIKKPGGGGGRHDPRRRWVVCL